MRGIMQWLTHFVLFLVALFCSHHLLAGTLLALLYRLPNLQSSSTLIASLFALELMRQLVRVLSIFGSASFPQVSNRVF